MSYRDLYRNSVDKLLAQSSSHVISIVIDIKQKIPITQNELQGFIS